MNFNIRTSVNQMIAAGSAFFLFLSFAQLPVSLARWRRLKDLGKGNQQMENLQIEEDFVRRLGTVQLNLLFAAKLRHFPVESELRLSLYQETALRMLI